MVKLKIPQSQRRPLEVLLGLDAAKRSALLDRFEAAGADLMAGGFAEAVAETTGLGNEDAADVFYMLLGIYQSYSAQVLDAELLVEAIQADHELSAAITDEDRVVDFFDLLFGLTSSLGLVAKAFALSRGQARTFCTADIFSDLRPVFDDVADTPAAAMILHTLRITYHEGPGSTLKEVFIGLDAKALRSIEAVVERALDKEKSLQKLSQNAKMPVFGKEE